MSSANPPYHPPANPVRQVWRSSPRQTCHPSSSPADSCSAWSSAVDFGGPSSSTAQTGVPSWLPVDRRNPVPTLGESVRECRSPTSVAALGSIARSSGGIRPRVHPETYVHDICPHGPFGPTRHRPKATVRDLLRPTNQHRWFSP